MTNVDPRHMRKAVPLYKQARNMYEAGELAEVKIVEGDNAGAWIKCRVEALGREPGTYDIFILPEASCPREFANAQVPDIDYSNLRKPPKPDKKALQESIEEKKRIEEPRSAELKAEQMRLQALSKKLEEAKQQQERLQAAAQLRMQERSRLVDARRAAFEREDYAAVAVLSAQLEALDMRDTEANPGQANNCIGRWVDREGESATVSHDSVCFPDQTEANLNIVDANSFTVKLAGSLFKAELKNDQLHWCDGDVWAREENARQATRTPASAAVQQTAATKKAATHCPNGHLLDSYFEDDGAVCDLCDEEFINVRGRICEKCDYCVCNACCR